MCVFTELGDARREFFNFCFSNPIASPSQILIWKQKFSFILQNSFMSFTNFPNAEAGMRRGRQRHSRYFPPRPLHLQVQRRAGLVHLTTTQSFLQVWSQWSESHFQDLPALFDCIASLYLSLLSACVSLFLSLLSSLLCNTYACVFLGSFMIISGQLCSGKCVSAQPRGHFLSSILHSWLASKGKVA